MSVATAKARVLAGAAVLDAHGPTDWRSKVSLDRLDMSSSDNCILGQVFADYWNGRVALSKAIGVENDVSWARDLGFTAGTGTMFGELDNAWKEYLTTQPVTLAKMSDEAVMLLLKDVRDRSDVSAMVTLFLALTGRPESERRVFTAALG